jgi:Tfp pilus assembly protein PilO
MPKNETKILAIILIVIDILSIVAFIFLYNFTTNQITESVNKEDQIKLKLKKEDTITLMKDDLAQGKMFQDNLTAYMIPSGGTVEFIKTIEQLVLNTGLKSDIKTVANEPYDKGSAINAELLRVNMDVIGEWKNIQFFLQSLENYPLKINLVNVSFNKFSDYTINGKTVPQWSGTFEFTVVKIKDAK